MSDLQKLDEEISGLVTTRFRFIQRCGRFVRLVLIVGGSAFAAIAHFVTETQAPSAWHVAGIAASVLVAVGAAFMVLTETNAPQELQAAQRALHAAQLATEEVRQEEAELRERFAPFERDNAELGGALKRAVALYEAMQLMRDVVHAVVQHNGPVNLEQTLDALLETCERSIRLAAGFELDQHWTLAVYIAEFDDVQNRTVLRCFANIRSIRCDKADARKWPEGIGVAGVTYATGSEVVIPDLANEDRGNQYSAAGLAREHDQARYRSLAGVPVIVDADARPWGVVVATSDVPGHFRKSDPLGIYYMVAARALATMVALTVAASYRSAHLTATCPTGGVIKKT